MKQSDPDYTRLVAIVPTHNRLPELKETLQRLYTEPVNAIVVVDNASRDGTRAWLSKQNNTRLIVHLADQNLGGAGGFAMGMQIASDQFDPDWYVLMDDDARPQSGAFAAFHNLATSYDILSAAVYHPDGPICELNRPARNPFWNPAAFLQTVMSSLSGKGRAGFHIDDQAYFAKSIVPIDVGSFVGMFISRRTYQAIGLPDPRLFIYGDDVCYSLSARQAGLRVGFAPMIRFDHNIQTLQHWVKHAPLWKTYYLIRNGIHSYQRAAGLWFWPLAPYLIAKWVLRAANVDVGRRAYLSILFQAVRDGFLKRWDLPHSDLLRLCQTHADEVHQ